MTLPSKTFPESAGGPSKRLEQRQSQLSSNLSRIDALVTQFYSQIDHIFPPQRRRDLLESLRGFAYTNPKLSAFLCINLALSGLPLGLFALFSLSVFIFALISGVIFGFLCGIFITLVNVGIALIFLVPTIIFTTLAACFISFWVLVTYYLLQWAINTSPGLRQYNGELPLQNGAQQSPQYPKAEP